MVGAAAGVVAPGVKVVDKMAKTEKMEIKVNSHHLKSKTDLITSIRNKKPNFQGLKSEKKRRVKFLNLSVVKNTLFKNAKLKAKPESGAKKKVKKKVRVEILASLGKAGRAKITNP